MKNVPKMLLTYRHILFVCIRLPFSVDNGDDKFRQKRALKFVHSARPLIIMRLDFRRF